MKYLKAFFVVLAIMLVIQPCTCAVAPENDALGEDDALKQFFMALSEETKSEEIDSLAKQYGLYSSYINYGTATYAYRVAATKDIADVNTKAKGSYVSISFYILQNEYPYIQVFYEIPFSILFISYFSKVLFQYRSNSSCISI